MLKNIAFSFLSVPIFFNGTYRPLFNLFSILFKQPLQFLLKMIYNRCPPIIRCWDSSPQTLKHEPHPITTRFGFPPPHMAHVYDAVLLPKKLVGVSTSRNLHPFLEAELINQLSSSSRCGQLLLLLLFAFP